MSGLLPPGMGELAALGLVGVTAIVVQGGLVRPIIGRIGERQAVIYGSIVGALSLSLLSEMLRPLELFKWIVIPLLLILVMIFRPTGLIAFKEFDVKKVIAPKRKEV